MPKALWAWDPLTHYHINREIETQYDLVDFEDIYYGNGTGPDMFALPPSLGPVADYVHSPNPKPERNSRNEIIYPFIDKPNFAYLMLKIRGFGDSSSPFYASALGWGGHISADWVAHNPNLFLIPESMLSKEARFHARGEFLYDYYMYLTRGPISTSFTFYPKQIWKALVNYEMIRIHEDDLFGSDYNIKKDALDSTMKEWEIKARCRMWAGIVKVMQTAYFICKSKARAKAILQGFNPDYYLDEFIGAMRSRGAEENISLSKRYVGGWALALTPREKISLDIPVIPFTLVSAQSESISSQSASKLYPFFASEPAWASEVEPFSDPQPSEALNWSDFIAYSFWCDVATKAEEAGIMQVEEKTIAIEGGEEFKIHAEIIDEDKFQEILESVINAHIQNPTNDLGKDYAIFQRNFLINEIQNIDWLMDVAPPTITGLTPEDGSYTPWHKPAIFAMVEDDPLGIGIDEDSIQMEVDGQRVNYTYIKQLNLLLYTPEEYLSTGEHEVTIKVSDKAGNETKASWKFTIKTIFNHVLFSNKDLRISGNAKIIGNIYSNGDAVVSGSPEVQGDTTAVGSIIINGKPNIDGEVHENYKVEPFPIIDFEYYEHLVKTHGTYINGDINLKEPQGIIFVDGDVKLCGKNVNTTTIISTGAIEISGDLNLKPAVDGLILVAKGDIRSSGKGGITGIIHSSRRVKISGEKEYFGAIAAQNLEVSGKPLIRYDLNLSH